MFDLTWIISAPILIGIVFGGFFLIFMIFFFLFSMPYWSWERTQIQQGNLTTEDIDNQSVWKIFTSPFRFYFCKLSGKKYIF